MRVSSSCPAAQKIVPSGFTTAGVLLQQRGDQLTITTGSKQLDAILEGQACLGSMTATASCTRTAISVSRSRPCSRGTLYTKLLNCKPVGGR